MASRKPNTQGTAPQQSRSKPKPARPPVAGIEARALAVRLVRAVLAERRFFDDAIAWATGVDGFAAMAQRDRALARLIAATVMRRAGQIDAVLNAFLKKPLPAVKGALWPILQCAGAQLLFLGTKPHAAINVAVEQCRMDRAARRFDKLANAVLRKVATEGPEIIAGQDAARLTTPDWLWQRWVDAYGGEVARQIAEANLHEAALDISVKADPQHWAAELGGVHLPTGSVRLKGDGRIEDLAGFAEGAWWVQDAAAALPVKLLGDVAGARVADLCAAPGGKTAQLVSLGAKVTSVDQSGGRLARLRDNMRRLQLEAEIVEADAASWTPSELFDAVLLDAPCTATGTMRRHPDIRYLKGPDDVARMAALQARLLDQAASLVRPGGLIVYCSCSLEPEESVEQIEKLLQRAPALERVPVRPAQIGGEPAWITPKGDLRTLPCHLGALGNELSGLDGFFAARLRVLP